MTSLKNAHMRPQEYQQKISDRNKSIDELNKASSDVRTARVVVHEKIALFSAGTLSVMFTFVGVVLGMPDRPVLDSNTWSIFLFAMGFFLVTMIIGIIVRIFMATKVFYQYSQQNLVKEEDVIKEEIRIVEGQPVLLGSTRQPLTLEQTDAFLGTSTQKLEYIAKIRRRINRKLLLHGFVIRPVLMMHYITFIAAYGFLSSFVYQLILTIQ